MGGPPPLSQSIYRKYTINSVGALSLSLELKGLIYIHVPVQRCVPRQLMSLIHPPRMNVSARHSHLNAWQVLKEHLPATQQSFCRDQ